MAQNSKIEWTHHTFNPWWGCSKVSPACHNCYAEKWAKRVGQNVWGENASRRYFGDKHWQEPLRWNAQAKTANTRYRVFCASMADVFESRSDLDSWREKLWGLIDSTPYLDWLLLTKRPQNICLMVPWSNDNWPHNIWIGTTVETQYWAQTRIPILLEQGAKMRFLSCEPLLGSIDLSPWISNGRFNKIDWVIAGGESGAKSRPMNLSWIRGLRDTCVNNGIAFHFKQWGQWIPIEQIPEALRNPSKGDAEFLSLAKKKAGRLLDGRTWDELPKVGLRSL